jgi:hypothetical protein
MCPNCIKGVSPCLGAPCLNALVTSPSRDPVQEAREVERRVTGVAINHNDSGEIHSLPAPARHNDVIRELSALGHPWPIRGTQGFVLDDGTFVTRRAALTIAERAGQLLSEPIAPAHGLFSEDVW